MKGIGGDERILTRVDIAVVTVGESQHWVDSLVERAKKLKVGEGFDPSTDV